MYRPRVLIALAESYVEAAAEEAGAVAEMAAERKATKYAHQLEGHYLSQPIAVESLSPINDSATSFRNDLGRRIADVSSEIREGSYLFQRLSVLIQRFNAVLFDDSLFDEVVLDWHSRFQLK